MANKLKSYEVSLSQEKLVIVKAIDETDAINKAESKLNKTNDKWVANTAYELKGE